MKPVATPMLRAFAARLLECDSAMGNPAASQPDTALTVCEKLRGTLSAFAGNEGAAVVIARALALAQREVPWLGAVQANGDGSLNGLLEADPQLSKEDVAKGVVAIIAHVLGLLVGFLGEDLALSLVRRVWPEANFPEEERKDE